MPIVYKQKTERVVIITLIIISVDPCDCIIGGYKEIVYLDLKINYEVDETDVDFVLCEKKNDDKIIQYAKINFIVVNMEKIIKLILLWTK